MNTPLTSASNPEAIGEIIIELEVCPFMTDRSFQNYIPYLILVDFWVNELLFFSSNLVNKSFGTALSFPRYMALA
jgi:hypothetical protein